MDPSHTHAHIIGDIATVKNRIHKAIEVDLRDSLVVSSLPIVSPAHREPEDTTSALPYFMQLFLGSSSFAVVVALLIAQVFRPFLAPGAEAGRLRQMPETACHGTTCMTPASSSSSSVRTRTVRSEAFSSSVMAIVRQSSASSADDKFNPFRRFHAAPPDEHAAEPVKRADNVQGVYFTSASVKRTSFFDETVDNLLAAHGDAVVFDTKGGIVMYDSQAPMATELGLVKPQYNLNETLQKLHEKGIYTIARFVSAKDYGFTAKRPDTLPKNPQTGAAMGTEWIDPSNSDALEYNRQLISELACAGIDEINLDYIRFSTANFGQLMVFSTEEKASKVEAFVKMAREAIDSCPNSHTRLGLSTYAILGWDYDVNVRTLGQDVKRFAPYVDIISPMAYQQTFGDTYNSPSASMSREYYLVKRTLDGYKKMLDEVGYKGAIRPWIQGYYISAQNMRNEIQAVYDAGMCGFQVWNANNNYGQTFAGMEHPPQKPERCL